MKTRDVQTSEIFDIIQQHIREYLVMLRNRENLSVAQLSEKAGLDENVLIFYPVSKQLYYLVENFAG